MVQSKVKTCDGTWTEPVTETDAWASVTKRRKGQIASSKIHVWGENYRGDITTE